jgi:hypothetical protein
MQYLSCTAPRGEREDDEGGGGYNKPCKRRRTCARWGRFLGAVSATLDARASSLVTTLCACFGNADFLDRHHVYNSVTTIGQSVIRVSIARRTPYLCLSLFLSGQRNRQLTQRSNQVGTGTKKCEKTAGLLCRVSGTFTNAQPSSCLCTCNTMALYLSKPRRILVDVARIAL